MRYSKANVSCLITDQSLYYHSLIRENRALIICILLFDASLTIPHYISRYYKNYEILNIKKYLKHIID
jgi:hypothetical protein